MTSRVVIYGMNYAPEIAGVGRYTGEVGEYLAEFAKSMLEQGCRLSVVILGIFQWSQHQS